MLVEFSKFLIDFREPNLLDRYRRRHELIMKKLDHPDPANQRPVLETTRSVAGRTPHRLLRYLATHRMDADTRRLVRRKQGELERKFGPLEGEASRQVVKVASPFDGRDMATLSDDAWLELICNAGRRRSDRYRMRNDRLEYSTLEGYLPELHQAARRQPERFGKLALKIPETCPADALGRIFWAVSEQKPPDGLPANETAHWSPASFSKVRALLELPRAREEETLANAYCMLAGRYAENRWSDPICRTVCRIAEGAPDSPSVDGPEDERDWTTSPADLASKALNCPAGSAAIAIGKQLLSFPDQLDVFEGAIRSLCRNPNPAVKTASLRALRCVPADRESLILSLLSDACQGAPDAMLATGDALAILRYFGREQPERLVHLIDRMLSSYVDAVATEGAAIATAAYLTTGLLEDRSAACAGGTTAQRTGVAAIAAGWINEPDYHDWCTEMTLRFAEHRDDDIHEAINNQIHHWDLSLLARSDDFLERFATTRTFRIDPSSLLHRLDSHEDTILPFAPCLVAAGRTLAEHLAAEIRDPSTHVSSSLHYLIPLMLRLYEESSKPGYEDIHLQCLDLWDLLLERRIEIARELTAALDQI